MRVMIAVALVAGLMGNGAMAQERTPQNAADLPFYIEVEPLIEAAACVRATDMETIAVLAVLLRAARIRHYGPHLPPAEEARVERMIEAAEAFIRASIAQDPYSRCFAAGRRLERILPR